MKITECHVHKRLWIECENLLWSQVYSQLDIKFKKLVNFKLYNYVDDKVNIQVYIQVFKQLNSANLEKLRE
jgi:hypothetical protein